MFWTRTAPFWSGSVLENRPQRRSDCPKRLVSIRVPMEYPAKSSHIRREIVVYWSDHKNRGLLQSGTFKDTLRSLGSFETKFNTRNNIL